MNEETTAAGAPKRPQFLTVLCILSFIGCGLGLFGGISGYFTNKALADGGMQKMMQAIGNAAGGEEASELAEASAEMDKAMEMMGGLGMDFNKMAINSLVVGLLCLVIVVGVWMMWNQKKQGFYIYTAGQIASILSPFLIIGGGFMGGMMGIAAALVPVIFIGLYAMNLKHMH